MSHRNRILAAYKELLSLIRRLPADKRSNALVEARETMKNHVHESDPTRQSDLFKLLVAKISFLRTVTPRRPGDASSIVSGHYVLREGKLVEGSGRSMGTRFVVLLLLLQLLLLHEDNQSHTFFHVIHQGCRWKDIHVGSLRKASTIITAPTLWAPPTHLRSLHILNMYVSSSLQCTYMVYHVIRYQLVVVVDVFNNQSAAASTFP